MSQVSSQELSQRAAALEDELNTAFIERLLEEGLFEFENLISADFISGTKLPAYRPSHKNQHFALKDLALLTSPLVRLYLEALPTSPSAVSQLSEQIYLAIKAAPVEDIDRFSQLIRILAAILSPTYTTHLAADGVIPHSLGQDPYLAYSHLVMRPHTPTELAALITTHIPPLPSSKGPISPEALL